MELPLAPLAVVGEEEGLVGILRAYDLRVHGEGVDTVCSGGVHVSRCSSRS